MFCEHKQNILGYGRVLGQVQRDAKGVRLSSAGLVENLAQRVGIRCSLRDESLPFNDDLTRPTINTASTSIGTSNASLAKSEIGCLVAASFNINVASA
jgi:hypothetical protein